LQFNPANAVTARTLTPTTLRRATSRDSAAVSALLATTWHNAYDTIMGEAKVTEVCDSLFSVAELHRSLALRGPMFQGILEHGGTLAGFVSLQIGPLGAARLHMLYVLPTLQRRGIGSSFLDYAPAIFPWASSITIEVLEANAKAIRRYEQGGYRKVGVSYHRPPDVSVPVIAMTRHFPGRGNRLKALTQYAKLVVS
jgi:ribosomal protein S18 acetylase RimI-like enzyme